MDEELATRLTEVIRAGDVERLETLLGEQPDLANARLPGTVARTLLHVATDWPGNWKRAGETIRKLVAAGADVDATLHEAGTSETPLHWAASSDDVDATVALLDCGASIAPTGGCIASATPLELAVIYEKYAAARVLLERGAPYHLPVVAALGRRDLIEPFFRDGELRRDCGHLPNYPEHPPTQILLDRAFQFACRGGYLDIAQTLLRYGADKDARTPIPTTALDEARSHEHAEVVAWLTSIGAASIEDAPT